METLRIELHIPQAESEPKKGFLYRLGYIMGQHHRKAYPHKSLSTIEPMFRDWSKDYSDLESPAVYRKRR